MKNDQQIENPEPMMTETVTAVIGALLVMLGPVSLALYTPALPTLVQFFDTTPASIQATLTIYFVGFALAQLICGPLSDAYGRRPVALIFFTLYLIGSLTAGFAPSVAWLLCGRLLQGIGAATGVVVARAIVRDQFTGQASARVLNWISFSMATLPSLSPALGGLILSIAEWRLLFLIMTGVGTLVIIILVFVVPETNKAAQRNLAHPSRVLRNYAALVTSKSFMRAGLILGLGLGGLYTLSAVLPFILINRFGLSPSDFGLVMLLQPLSYSAGSLLAARLLIGVSADRLIPFGLAIVGTAGVAFATAPLAWTPTVVTVCIPIGIWAFGLAFLLPGTTAGALEGFPAMAGSAASLIGFLQIGGGLMGSALAAVIGDPATALMFIMPGMAFLAVLTQFLLRPVQNIFHDRR